MISSQVGACLAFGLSPSVALSLYFVRVWINEDRHAQNRGHLVAG